MKFLLGLYVGEATSLYHASFLSDSDRVLLTIRIEDECSNVLRDYFTRRSFELDELLQKSQSHECFLGKACCLLACLFLGENNILKEVSKFLDVLAIIL